MSFPFFGQIFSFKQPDGTTLTVRGWGDQDHAVFETLDGYTVVKDPISGFYSYAALSDEADELHSTGVRIGLAAPQSIGLSEGLRVSANAERAVSSMQSRLPRSRWRDRIHEQRLASQASFFSAGAMPAPPARQTVGTYVGLCLLIQFPDVPGTISQHEVDNFCNQIGYTGYGNHGSVYDYYFDNSVGKLQYKTIVAPYYTSRHARAYYTNESIPEGQRARELIKEALSYHLANGFDFSSLTADTSSAVYATNVFYAGERVNNWAKGLWPHSSRLTAPFPLAPGKNAVDYQITNMGNVLELGTYCHENGHMLCDFPDLYNYTNQRRGIGQYCLMCAGGNVDPLNPHQIGAYLKYRAGWGNPAASLTSGQHLSSTANQNEFFIYPKNATEYFILENRNRSGRDATLADSGLAIWHIDELGSNSSPEQAPAGHNRFECSLVQADGRDDLGAGINQGDNSDLFRSGLINHFDSSVNSSKWFDGTTSNIAVRNIGSAGNTITFDT